MNFAENTNHVVELMSSADTLRFAGALAGFSWSYGTPRFLVEYPFSSVFQGAVGAAIAVFCAELVDGFLPQKFRPVLVGTLMASTVYHMYRSCTPRDKRAVAGLPAVERQHPSTCVENQQPQRCADERQRIVDSPAPPKYDA